jgi:hypothetical protein
MQQNYGDVPMRRLDIAVIGTGISGLSAAWLLSRRHSITVFEADNRIGGHSHTVTATLSGRSLAVDTGFIVYNEPAYPNLTALFRELGVSTAATDMSFAVSLDAGTYEYAGSDVRGLLAQPSNLLKRRFWSMLADLRRFYRDAPRDLPEMAEMTLGEYLDREGYGRPFRDDHLYPLAAAVWSTPANEVDQQPAAAFVRFSENHGLLKFTGRPLWRTVKGGSKEYVSRLTQGFRDRILTSTAVAAINRRNGAIEIVDASGKSQRFDHVVVATHGDQALRLLGDPSPRELQTLGAIRYTRNDAVLHTDTSLMPRRRSAWASWNYLANGSGEGRRLSVTYWMNRLQPLGEAPPIFLTLNPLREPRPGTVISQQVYEHPVVDVPSDRAREMLWSLQGDRNTWFCGAYFGAGFHEDGLQAGLAVAEDLGGLRRPWRVAGESARIARRSAARHSAPEVAA